MSESHKVAKIAELAPGSAVAVEVGGQDIAIFNVDGGLYAIENDCKHRGGPLHEGELEGTVVTCPLHAWTYDVSTGECFDDPDCGVTVFPVRIDGEDIVVEV